jgi:hypothetical protein
MAYDWRLGDSQGLGFTLFREPRHTAEDVEKAKAFIRSNQDVSGHIRVKPVTGNPIST